MLPAATAITSLLSLISGSNNSMAAGGGGTGVAPCGEGGRAEWLRTYDRVVAMLAQVEALAADRARLEAVNELQHEFWDARDGVLQARLLQADESRRRWEASYMELLPGDNQKFAELQESDLEDSRTCIALFAAENSEIKIQLKELGSCVELSQNTADHEHIARDLRAELRKLKQAYETVSSKKDKEVSALIAEKYFLRHQLRVVEQDYAELRKYMKIEAAQATEAAQKLQQNVEQLQVATQKKDDEISRLRAEALGAKKKAKEKDDDIQKLKGEHPETSQKHKKDINETHRKSRSDDPVLRGKSKNNSPRQMVEKDGQPETSQKRKCASSLSNDDEQNGNDEETTSNQVLNALEKPKRSDAGQKREPRKRKAEQEDPNAQLANGKSDDESNGLVQPRSLHMPAALPHVVEQTIKHALLYVRTEKDNYVDQPDKYERFLAVLREYSRGGVGDA